MKILIVSDTHRQNKNLLDILEKMDDLDVLIHLGDIEGSETTISMAAGCRVEMIAGNNDFFSELPGEKIIELDRYQVMLTHGHRYYIGMGDEMLKDEARAKGVDIVMYGHTHRPKIEKTENLVVLNPGSLSYPRQEGKKPTYIIMEIAPDGQTDYTLHYIE